MKYSKSDFYEMQTKLVKDIETFDALPSCGCVPPVSPEQIEYYKAKGKLDLINDILR